MSIRAGKTCMIEKSLDSYWRITFHNKNYLKKVLYRDLALVCSPGRYRKLERAVDDAKRMGFTVIKIRTKYDYEQKELT